MATQSSIRKPVGSLQPKNTFRASPAAEGIHDPRVVLLQSALSAITRAEIAIHEAEKQGRTAHLDYALQLVEQAYYAYEQASPDTATTKADAARVVATSTNISSEDLTRYGQGLVADAVAEVSRRGQRRRHKRMYKKPRESRTASQRMRDPNHPAREEMLKLIQTCVRKTRQWADAYPQMPYANEMEKKSILLQVYPPPPVTKLHVDARSLHKQFQDRNISFDGACMGVSDILRAMRRMQRQYPLPGLSTSRIDRLEVRLSRLENGGQLANCPSKVRNIRPKPPRSTPLKGKTPSLHCERPPELVLCSPFVGIAAANPHLGPAFGSVPTIYRRWK